MVPFPDGEPAKQPTCPGSDPGVVSEARVAPGCDRTMLPQAVPQGGKSLAWSPGSGADPGDSIRRHSRSFSFASRLLPAVQRAAVQRLYAWCRWCDDGVDCSQTAEQAVNFLDLAAADLRLIRAGRRPTATESCWLADLVGQYRLPVAAAEALLLGMRSDLTPAADLSEDDLLQYCFRVAGAVGVLMCPILGLRDRRFLPQAAALGMGMQMTNIARDVAEDWNRGRCYLPVAWTSGLRPGESEPAEQPIRSGVRQILDTADGYYAAGESGIAALDRRSRLAVRTASRVYHAIGTAIRNRRFRVWHHRARVPTWRKLGLFAGAVLAPVNRDPSRLSGAADQALLTAAELLRNHGVA